MEIFFSGNQKFSCTLAKILRGVQQLFYCSMLFVCLILMGCHAAPPFQDTRGNQIDFAKLSGKWVLINYWASWCKPCHEEIPALNTFAKQYATQVVVLGVNYQETQQIDNLRLLVQKMHIDFPVLTSDPISQWQAPPLAGLPATLIINPQGKYVTTLHGPQTVSDLQQATGLT